jgi:G:T/U-mismatch repair DNA glycosylase
MQEAQDRAAVLEKECSIQTAKATEAVARAEHAEADAKIYKSKKQHLEDKTVQLLHCFRSGKCYWCPQTIENEKSMAQKLKDIEEELKRGRAELEEVKERKTQTWRDAIELNAQLGEDTRRLRSSRCQ